MGSASETEYHLILAFDLGYIDELTFQKVNSDLIEVKQMLAGLIKKLRVAS